MSVSTTTTTTTDVTTDVTPRWCGEPRWIPHW
jgi:hypothetical protein